MNSLTIRTPLGFRPAAGGRYPGRKRLEEDEGVYELCKVPEDCTSAHFRNRRYDTREVSVGVLIDAPAQRLPFLCNAQCDGAAVRGIA